MKRKKNNYDDSTCIKIVAFIGKSGRHYQTLELKNLDNFEVSVNADYVNLIAGAIPIVNGKRNYNFKDFRSKVKMQKFIP